MPELGTFEGMTARMYVPTDGQLMAFKPTSIPLAVRDGVTQEIQGVEHEDILVTLKSSIWATPIVPVLESDIK